MAKRYLTKKKKKDILLEALEKSMGIVSSACKTCNISRTTFYQYMKEDEEFKKNVDNIQEMTIDFVESRLLNNIREGDTTAAIFYLKTKARHRGYNERIDIEGKQDVFINLVPYKQNEIEGQKPDRLNEKN